MKAQVRIDARGTVISVDREPGEDSLPLKRLWDVCCFDQHSDPRPLLDAGFAGPGFDLLVEPKDEDLFLTIIRQAGVPIRRVIQA